MTDEASMLKAITSYFGWGVDLTQPIIDFLTTDLNDSQNPQIDFLARPLIKIGSQYIWLSSFLRDRKWEVLMQKRILNDGLINLNTQTQGIEKGLADNFIEAGFKALASYKYEDKVKHFSGEIDTLAYKDNSLFVIEIKTTHIEENLMRYAAYQALRFEYKAASQLERNLDFIKTNFDSFKKIPELNIECSLEELKIIPLIVSNIFESDDILINEQFLKVSLFELMVILNNDLFETLSSPSGLALGSSEFNISAASVIQSFNRRAPGFNQNHSNPISKEQCNLWSSMDACSPEDIINAIRTRIVWQGLDEMMEFKVGESIPIGPY